MDGTVSMSNVLEFLYKDFYSNCNLIYLLENNIAKVDLFDGINVIISIDEEVVLIVSDNKEVVDAYLNSNNKIIDLSIISNYDFSYLVNRFNTMLDTNMWVYDKKEKVNLNLDGIDIRKLDISNYEYIVNRYKHVSDGEYIYTLLNRGMLGIFVDDEIVGFIGIHDTGSIGVLTIEENYRKNGFGYILEGALINEQLEKGITPFCQVEKSNKASIKLQNKLGLRKSDKTMLLFF